MLMDNLNIELIRYEKLKHVKFFVNKIQHRQEHIHNEFEFFLVLRGHGTAKIKSKTYNIKENDLYFINSGEVHSYMKEFEKGMANADDSQTPIFLFAQVSNHFLMEYYPRIRTTVFQSGNLRDYLSEKEVQEIISSMILAATAYFSQPEFYQFRVIHCLAKTFETIYHGVPFEVVSEAQKQSIKKKTLQLERIISYIDSNFESQIRLNDLAEQENLSPTHFSHLFSAAFGVTFQQYVNIKRMEQSIRLMSNKEKTLLEISYESGFSDPKYMNKMFLTSFGCTPKEYRNTLEGAANNDETPDPLELERIYSAKEAIAELNSFAKRYQFKGQ